MLHHSQGLPSFPTQNAYAKEEESFMKTVEKVLMSKVPTGSNVISSHVLYRVKVLDAGSRMIKARIAPHGNKDKDRKKLKTDSAVCCPVEMRIMLSVAVINGWKLCKIDFKSEFLQSGCAECKVYVIPPRECKNSSFYWLLLTAAYGLVNANAKWQEEIDSAFTSLGFTRLLDKACPILITVKIVDDVLMWGEPNDLGKVVKYKIGTIVTNLVSSVQWVTDNIGCGWVYCC